MKVAVIKSEMNGVTLEKMVEGVVRTPCGFTSLCPHVDGMPIFCSDCPAFKSSNEVMMTHAEAGAWWSKQKLKA